MKLRKILAVVTILLATSVLALAADVTGKWTAEVPGRGGQTRKMSFNLKADGSALTGTITGAQGRENPISDGKVDGNNASWTVTMETPNGTIKSTYTAKLDGDDLKVKSQREGSDRTQEFTAKRAQ